MDAFTHACERGQVDVDVNPVNSAKFFLLGIYALLITDREPSPARHSLIDEYIHNFCRGLGAR